MTTKKYPSIGNYDKYPKKKISLPGEKAFAGWGNIADQLALKSQGTEKTIITVECYPGARVQEIVGGLKKLAPSLVLFAEDFLISEQELTDKWQYNLTDDRVFGRMTTAELSDYYPKESIEKARQRIAETENGICLIIGTGASLISHGDILVYCDLSRWEIQLRWREGEGNWHCNNGDAPQLTKYKRGFFVEWRLADRLKEDLLGTIDFFIDVNRPENPKMISGTLFRCALERFSKEPFRLVPYFDPGPWGGQWMKSVFSLAADQSNFAWSFDGVPEENSLMIETNGSIIEFPAMNLVLYRPENLLGQAVYGRFGAEFPIRFDLLDTMDGGNLSLQVHPLTSYIQKKFGMHYTQDESYYILDCCEDACVYLGVKTGVSKDEMMNALRKSELTGEFDADNYVNKISVKKHDHILIPAGTIHCSGKNAMVLEVSATPYIFTFKLYDWGRLGMDGKPRPIHISHGEKVIQWNRDTKWVEENLIHQEKLVAESEGYLEEKTGLHQLEFIDTTRYCCDRKIVVETKGSVNMLNLVEGAEALIESTDGSFEPFEVHYAETFVIPESVKEYTISPSGAAEKKKISVLCARVKV